VQRDGKVFLLHARQFGDDGEVVLVLVNIERWRPAGRKAWGVRQTGKRSVEQTINLVSQIGETAQVRPLSQYWLMESNQFHVHFLSVELFSVRITLSCEDATGMNHVKPL
jgi:hypothetical protein